MKKTFVNKLILSTLGIVLTVTLFLQNEQTANAANIKDANSQIQIVEMYSNNDSNSLKEDIKLVQFKGGYDEQKIKLLNEKISNDISPSIHKIESISTEPFNILGSERLEFPYEINLQYKITNNSNSLISLYSDFFNYTGGAHGNTIRYAYTINKEKEEILSLKDLFNKGYDYNKIINDEIKKQININPEKYFESAKQFQEISYEQNFYIEKDNLVIYYQQYEIAPYASGIPEFKIPLNLFRENFLYKEDF